MVVEPLPIAHAISILEETDYLTYRRHIRLLRGDKGQTYRAIAAHTTGQCSMILFRELPRADIAEVYLIGDDSECIGQAIMDLPSPETGLSVFLTQRELPLLPLLQSLLVLDDPITRYDLHCSQRTISHPSGGLRSEVIQFRNSHRDSLSTVDIDEGGFADWLSRQWKLYFERDQPVFGIIDGGRVASFCAMAFDGEVSMIYTFPRYQNRGFAKQVLYVATRYVLDQGSMAYYNVEAHNEASIATARSVGYVQHSELTNYRRASRLRHEHRVR